MRDIANILTLTRLALLPFIVLLLFIPAGWAAWICLVLYTVGALTDWLDGWVARRRGRPSAFGAAMDPIADKIFIVTILLMLVAVDRVTGLFVVAIIVILVREFLVAGLREFLGPKDIKLPVTALAKWKTGVQMTALGFLIMGPYVWGCETVGLLTLSIAAALTAITGWHYLKASLPHIRE